MFRTVPEVFRAAGPASVSRFLRNKDWSHIVPRSSGGADTAANGRWEVRALNRARGARIMMANEIAAAERVAASAAYRERLRQLARRAGRGAAIGAVIVAATMIARLAIEYRAGRISEDELLARVTREVAREAVIGAALGAIFSGLSASHPVLAPVFGPIAVFIAAKLWSIHGQAIWNDMAQVARRWWEAYPLFRGAARAVVRVDVGVAGAGAGGCRARGVEDRHVGESLRPAARRSERVG